MVLDHDVVHLLNEYSLIHVVFDKLSSEHDLDLLRYIDKLSFNLLLQHF